MRDEIIAQLYAAYGVSPHRLLPMQKGYRNESHPVVLTHGSRLNLIIYKSEPGIVGRIKNSNSVGDFLHRYGLPARSTADPRILRVARAQGTAPAKYAALYHYLPGETIPWEGYTMAHIRALGAAMSDMHFTLQNLPAGGKLPSVSGEYQTIFARLQEYFSAPDVRRALRQKLGLSVATRAVSRAQKLFTFCETLDGQQALHMDFVRSNVLFADDGSVAGIIDFEKTGRGHPVLDIARTLAFLLVDCKHKEPAKIYKYFLRSGYNKRGAARFLGSRRLLDELITAFLLHDFYKFLRHNPYEFLGQNEHFVRTMRELKARGALSA